MPNEGQTHWHSPRDEAQLYRLAQAGDLTAREELVERHWNLIWHIVHRFQGRGYDPEDLFQVGAIGLLKAIDRFDVDRGLKFSTYAVPLIMGEIRRHMRDDQPIRVARSLRELGMRVEQVRSILSQQLGRDPTPQEVAEKMGVDPSDIAEAMEAIRAPASLNQPIESLSGSETHLGDTVRDDVGESDWLEQMALSQAFGALDERERFILRARFVEGRTQTEVARRLNVSQVQISRLERRALDRLKLALNDDPPPDPGEG
ncbi:SigB/SigF/SigG family RNA polymerase sigma factor [Sulfobacillus thermosulfidooxidans]|uniref:SigB/SigF/SigG family RNA polymerase sigma factor n=1 Tax=Sulfobacillus thermosulfidooxidans TaxID=28034 RepID=UPI0006B681DD|nr:SigB/SigF/SigG family RNA polymerase sigma factor [Sulfobacillus thermosulfidooxidans]